ncbi:ADP-dependent glucokinase [Galendromus occidentalis]|uniref:ADP-dependent glucokinase n=1 Tax=Galendromus occidentalis TaxID=34638 RepID=A0AAJ6QP77_9ACAR|nr:ADP-dependent glucokinase [Galendromus occidentalis]
MAVGKVSWFLLSGACLVLVVALWMNRSDENQTQHRLQLILQGLLKTETELQVEPSLKIAVGFGACLDVIVPSRHVFRNLKAPERPRNHDVLNTHDELLETFTYYFKHGAAAERFVANATLFREVLQQAKSSSEWRSTLGGNAALLATRFALEGAQVLLGSHMSADLKESLPEGVTVAGPEIDEDDYHMLLEYAAGEKFIQYKAPRANRFIIHNDHVNPRFRSIEGFDDKMKNFQPSLFVLGGVHVMDNFPYREGQLDSSMNRLLTVLQEIPTSTAIHFEMGSFVDHDLLKRIVRQVLPLSQSLGMNEQELANLNSLLKYDNISYVSDSYPRVATVLDQTRELFQSLYDSAPNGRPLSRIHIHTLAFQAILRVVRDPKHSVFEWMNTRASAAKSALTAHRHTCGSHDIDINRAKIIMDDSFTTTNGPNRQRIPFDPDEPVRCWNEVLQGTKVEVEFCVAPVLVCTKVLQTGGGGDNVSAAGLVLQV